MSTEAPIISRHLRLRKQVLEPSASDAGVTFEGLIDALLVLYEECSQDKVKSKNDLVAAFLAKFQSTVHSYQKLRVNIGDFQVKRVIGRGNFGDVKLAKEKGSGAVYALKVMKKVGDNTSAFFSEERDIMARNKSPWLTKLDYAFQDSNFLYLAMEYHCGGDLLSLMDRHDNVMEEESVRFYTAEVALGIHDLHKMGFVHRDIKPENILIDRTGHVKLADFGNAAKLSASGTVSKVMPVGTPDYIAPEVLQCLQGGHCKSDSHGAQCDYWSLGVLAFEMFYGKTPFTDMDGSVINTYSNIMMHTNKLSFPADRDAPKDLKSLIENLLQPADKRLGHSRLVRHPFFSPLDWSNMLNTPPPFVPQVHGQEDDSHFDMIDDEPTPPDIASLKPKKEFKNLPFIGFTFTSAKETIKSLEKGENNSLEAELKRKVDELEKMKLKNFQLQQQALNHTRVTETSVRDFEQVEKLSTQLSIAEQDNAELKSTIANIERILDIERQDRAATEQKTLHLLTDVRKKWARAEEERMEVVKSELAEEREKSNDFESKYRESQGELRKCQSELEAVVGVKNQLKTKLKDYKQRLENVAALEEKRTKKIATLESDKAALNSTLQQVKTELDESRSLDGKVDALQLIIEQRDQIVKEKDAEIKIKSTEIESFTVEQKKSKKLIRDLEDQVKAKVKECEKLQTELEVAKNETIVETDSQLCVQAQLKSEIKDILAENAELKGKFKEVEDKLKESKSSSKTIIDENKKLKEKLETNKKDFEKEAKDQESMYKEKMSGLEKVFETLQNRIDELQAKRKADTDLEINKEIKDLEAKLDTLEKEKVQALKDKNNLESDLEKSKKEVSKIKLEKSELECELQSVKEKKNELGDDSEKFVKLKKENESLVQELKEVKLDLRMEKREVEKKSSLVTYIREKEATSKGKIEELEKVSSTQEKELQSLKLSLETALVDAEKLTSAEEKIQKHLTDIRKIKDEKNEMTIEIRKLKTDASAFEDRVGRLNKRIEQLETEREGFDSLKINNDALTEVSAELERQVMDFERINEKLEIKIQSLESDKREFQANLDKEKEETRKAKVAVNEEKSKKIHVESKIKELKQRIDETEKDLEEEKKSREKHVGEYKSLCKKLSDTLEELTKDNATKDQFGKLNERAKTILEVENVQLKEELAEKTTQLYSHKESNFKLSQGIEEAIEKISAKNIQVDELQMKMESEARMAKEKFLRHEATQAQQTKLIDFLQTKVNQLEGRKKTFADKVFGNKENRPTGNSVPIAYGDLEGLLEREKSKNKKLSVQLDRARAEVVALKTTTAEPTTPLLKSMLNTLDGSTGTHSHNIPHRLVVGTIKKSVKCPVCMETIGFMSTALTCKDCGLWVHQSCSTSLPNTCGLSSQLAALHMDSTPTPTSSIITRPLPPAPTNSGVCKEGKIQTLLSGQWTETYLVLNTNGTLDMYNTSDVNQSNKRDQLGLTLPHCRVSLQSSVSYGEVFYMNSTDRPYTFKLSVHAMGKQEKAMYFMCQNFATKVDWVNQLEEVIKSSPANLVPVEGIEPPVSRQVVCSLPPPEEVLAVVRLEEAMVVGTTQGLATVTDGVVVKCETIDTPVHMIQHIKSLNLLVLATGGDGLPSQLVTVETRPVLSRSGPLHVDSLPEVTKCHIFSCMETTQGKVYLCAANDHLVTIMEWSHKRGHFVLRNKFSTDQHTRTIHFTDHSVLVGTSKFYEIDLKNFSAEEFLDLSHPGIQKVVNSSEFQGGQPHCVLDIISTQSDEREYALAFTRHILFVDSFGQEIQPPLVFEKLPIEHRLLGRILVTTFCDGIQFLNLDAQRKPADIILPCSSPHLVNNELVEKDLLYTCQDTASNNLMIVNMGDMELCFT